MRATPEIDRQTETVTLHFALPAAPVDRPVTFHAMGRTYDVTPHTAATHDEYRASNPALALIPREHLSSISHFAADVTLPADAVCFVYATYPAQDPASVAGDIAISVIHVPAASRRLAAERRMRTDGALRVPLKLRQLGVDASRIANRGGDRVELQTAVATVVTPIETAKSILFQHPEIASINAEVAADVLDEHLDAALDDHDELWSYISEHGAGSSDPWQRNGYAKNADGCPFEPPDDILDKDGKPVPWPTDPSGKRRIPQSDLADGTLRAAKPALDDALRRTKNDPKLHGHVWKRNHGIPFTQDKQGTEAPRRAGGPGPPSTDAAGQADAYKWSLANPGSGFGLDIQDDIRFNAESGMVSLSVANTANRCLGAYVQFLKANGDAFPPPGWVNRTKEAFQPNPTKKYLAFLRPASTIFGIPLPAAAIELSFPFPDEAVKAELLLGGLGIDPRDDDVDLTGVISTALLNYGIPTFMIAMGVGLSGTEWYFGLLTNPTVLELVLGVCADEFGNMWRSSLTAELLLTRAASGIATILFTRALIIPITSRLVAWSVGQQAAQAIPIAGWVMKIMALTAAAGNLISTTVAVASSPSTYNLKLARAIDVQAVVSPDPVHGGVWPENFDHYELVLTHQSGVSQKLGPFPRPVGRDTKLDHTFLNVPAGRGEKMQVSANLYAKNEWLCGAWVSDWVNAVGADGSTTVVLAGTIVERQVPLTQDTTYSHKRKLTYDASRQKHDWLETPEPPPGVWSTGGTGEPGHNVSRLVNVTSNNQAHRIGYTWMASGQHLPLDYGTDPVDSQAYAFQSLGAGTDPESSLKQPGRTFSIQPYLAFDQFGPVPLLTLPLSFQAELDVDGQPVSDGLRQAFVSAQHPLPASVTKKVVVKSAEWWLGGTGESGYLFVLKRQPASIAVYPYPNPEFSTRNFYLDPRGDAQQRQHLRHVALDDPSKEFDYSVGKSWGVFTQRNLDAVVIHPRGYAIGISYQNHKMEVLRLPGAAVADADAPVAIPVSGKGGREGLVNGPTAMTVTADGRVLVLEQGNARVQAFDVLGNPAQCFAGELAFDLSGSFAATLDQRTVTPELAEALQRGTIPDLAPLAHLPLTVKADLDAGRFSEETCSRLGAAGVTLAGTVTVKAVQPGRIWLLRDETAGYDLRDDGHEIPVRRGASYTVEVQSRGAQWVLRDMVNVQTFRVRKTADGALGCRQLIARMPLRDPQAANVEYLDIASEPEGFVYVLSYVRPGAERSDYHLDLYNPDGTFLARTPKDPDKPGVNAAKITVDQWRTLYSLNYEVILGPGGRTEPSVSHWAPSAPPPPPPEAGREPPIPPAG